ncbi:ANK1 [Symbiodinium sp. CCMP2592]|nr:ANK1 [Symbiodinium sp. CCMP2592]
MDWSCLAWAGAGFVSALAFVGGSSRTRAPAEPIVCHCNCASSSPSESEASGLRDWGLLLLVLLVLVGVFANVVLVLKFDIKKLAGDQEYTLSIKGKGGSKGVYGARKGLELIVAHARLVLAHVDSFDHVILTPDLDLYTETLDTSNGDFIRFWAPTPNGSIPAGVPASRVYAFGAMDVADYTGTTSTKEAWRLVRRGSGRASPQIRLRLLRAVELERIRPRSKPIPSFKGLKPWFQPDLACALHIAVGLMNDTPPQGGGLQLSGPATVLNILKSVRDQNFTLTAFHEHWLRVGEIPKGIYEHECLSRILRDHRSDQCPSALRARAHLPPDAHRISPSAPDYSAADHFMGWRYRKATQVDSDLVAHVATELKNEAAIAKESRKAREEQKLRRRPPKGPKGGVFLISSVVHPLLAVGKLLKKGWEFRDGTATGTFLTEGTTKIAVNYNNNSLTTRAFVRAVN